MLLEATVYFESSEMRLYNFKDRLEDMFEHFKNNIETDEYNFVVERNTFSQKFEENLQVVASVMIDFFEEDLNVDIGKYNIEEVLRNLMEIYFSDDAITPFFMEEINVVLDNNEKIEIGYIDFVSEMMGMQDTSKEAKIRWDNFKRCEKFLDDIDYDDFADTSKRIKDFRIKHAVNTKRKIARKEVVKVEIEEHVNSVRKIFVID